MKKFEVIREIFETVMRVGISDNKQDAISEYTRDKMTNTIYVKKVCIPDVGNIDSVAVTALESDFSDACDSDVRIAFNGNIGKRVILYANEVELSILLEIRNYLRKWFGINKDVDAYQKVMNHIEQCNSSGFGTDLTLSFMKHILDKYYDTFVKPLINK
ncbi:hypothetical protein IKN40_02195 [bacterium]|nr:hypothetical protein [bacterium]